MTTPDSATRRRVVIVDQQVSGLRTHSIPGDLEPRPFRWWSCAQGGPTNEAAIDADSGNSECGRHAEQSRDPGRGKQVRHDLWSCTGHLSGDRARRCQLMPPHHGAHISTPRKPVTARVSRRLHVNQLISSVRLHACLPRRCESVPPVMPR